MPVINFRIQQKILMVPSCVRKVMFCLFWVCFFMPGSGVLSAQEAQLENIIVTNTRDDLLIFLNVTGAFTEKMENAALSGVPITFSYYINLYNSRNLWFDKKLTALKLTHTLKYNSLKKEFTIQRSWDTADPLVVADLESAKKIMCKIDSIKLIQLDKLVKGEQYQIRAKAELNKKTLPFNLHYVLFFISLWDFETDWYTIDFIY